MFKREIANFYERTYKSLEALEKKAKKLPIIKNDINTIKEAVNDLIKSTIEDVTTDKTIPRVISNQLLYRKHYSDAGFDITIDEDITVGVNSFKPLIHTGLHVAIPIGYYGLIKERSSLAAEGIFVMGGVIDAGYRGEILLNIANIGNKPFYAQKGERIAQLIIMPCKVLLELGKPENIPSDRGSKGFGSSGK